MDAMKVQDIHPEYRLQYPHCWPRIAPGPLAKAGISQRNMGPRYSKGRSLLKPGLFGDHIRRMWSVQDSCMEEWGYQHKALSHWAVKPLPHPWETSYFL